MVNREEKETIQIIGGLLIWVAIMIFVSGISFYYLSTSFYRNMEFALTLGILGIVVVVFGVALLVAAPSTKASQTISPPLEKLRCATCLTFNDPEAVYCHFCGLRLETMSEEVGEI